MKNAVEESNTIINTEPTTNEIESNSNVSNNNQPKELTEEEIRVMEEEVVRLVNEERAKHGLYPLEISEKLMKTAKLKSNDMATRNYFSHTDPDGYTLYKQLENLDNYWTIMENIVSGKSPCIAMNTLLNSKPHKEQILNTNYKYIGVGFNNGYWTQHFSMNDKWANEN
ncbi:MAG: transporter [Clostridiales bacterium]|nr:transporter [Clostridiales bacterium]